METLSRFTASHLLQAIAGLQDRGRAAVGTAELVSVTGLSASTLKRLLKELVDSGKLESMGKARATRYRVRFTYPPAPEVPLASHRAEEAPRTGPLWSRESNALRSRLQVPLGARDPVAYKRAFVDGYKPNESALLPARLADELAAIDRLPEQLPAGTYARKVLEQLLIDLSWSSSRLEGNRYTWLDTENLFKSGAAATDADAVMLLNHKAAIEFLVDAAPLQGLTPVVLRNLHAVLMQDLLLEPSSLGVIRQKVVNISGSVYVPMQAPQILGEMFERIIAIARLVRNPVEAAFFLWVNLAYLQPFEDGNKRVSRLAANIPLMLFNQAPLSFLDVERDDYAYAMMGVYEHCDVAMAVDLFEWTYRRSQAKYKVVLESMGSPDPFRILHREALGEAVQSVVLGRANLRDAAAALQLPEADVGRFLTLLAAELKALAVFNCARHRLGMRETQAWIDAGRPS